MRFETERTFPRSVQFIDTYFPIIDGVVQTVHNYAIHLNAAVVCPEMQRKIETGQFPYEVITCPAIRFSSQHFACAVPYRKGELIRKIGAQKPDILHAHSTALLGRLALSAGKRLGIPVVGSFHSKIYDAVLEFTKCKAIAWEETRKAVQFYERCDAVWACSDRAAETLRSYGYHGDIKIMTNGTDTKILNCPEKVQEKTAEIAARYSIPREKRILLFVGQQVWYKNLNLVLDTVRLLCDVSDQFCLIIAGTGKDENEIRAYAASLGLSGKQVIFTGQIADRKDLAALYENADLFFFPSVFDNAPLVVREAAVHRLPSLVVEGSNAAEAIVKDCNGFTAAENAQAMSNEITRIFKNPGLLRSAGNVACSTIPVSWDMVALQVQENYREIIAGYRKNRSH